MCILIILCFNTNTFNHLLQLHTTEYLSRYLTHLLDQNWKIEIHKHFKDSQTSLLLMWNICIAAYQEINSLLYYNLGKCGARIVTVCRSSIAKNTDLHLQGGRTRLPKFKFSANFPIGLHVILPTTDKKIQKCLISYVKKYFNRKSVEVQR